MPKKEENGFFWLAGEDFILIGKPPTKRNTQDFQERKSQVRQKSLYKW